MNEIQSVPRRANRMSLRAENAASFNSPKPYFTLFNVISSLANRAFNLEEGFK